jgi:hypothetical protein
MREEGPGKDGCFFFPLRLCLILQYELLFYEETDIVSHCSDFQEYDSKNLYKADAGSWT